MSAMVESDPQIESIISSDEVKEAALFLALFSHYMWPSIISSALYFDLAVKEARKRVLKHCPGDRYLGEKLDGAIRMLEKHHGE